MSDERNNVKANSRGSMICCYNKLVEASVRGLGATKNILCCSQISLITNGLIFGYL